MRTPWVALLGLALLTSFAAPVAANGSHGHPDHPMFDSGMMDHDAMWSRMFDEPGKYAYHCDPHPWMKGNVTVQPSDGSPPQKHQVRIVEGEDAQSWGFEPAEVTVRAGDTVEWVNEGQISHTVTSLDEAEQAEESPGVGLLAVLSAVGVALATFRRRA